MKQTFGSKVYSLVKQIPKGKVATYGQIAKLVGSPSAARAVGMCMKNNPDMTTIPCHRVVGSNGNLTGYSAKNGIRTKREMLEKENVKFKKDNVDLVLSQWKRKS